MTSEKRAQKFHSAQIWVALLISRVAKEICFNQSETLSIVDLSSERHQYRNCAVVAQTSFRGENIHIDLAGAKCESSR